MNWNFDSTDLIAWYGAIVGTYGALLSTYNAVQNKKSKQPHLKVECAAKFYNYLPSACKHMKSKTVKMSEVETYSLTAINTGQTDIHIDRWGIKLSDKQLIYLPPAYHMLGNITFPSTVKPKTQITAYIDLYDISTILAKKWSPIKGKFTGFFQDHEGKKYYSKPYRYNFEVFLEDSKAS